MEAERISTPLSPHRLSIAQGWSWFSGWKSLGHLKPEIVATCAVVFRRLMGVMATGAIQASEMGSVRVRVHFLCFFAETFVISVASLADCHGRLVLRRVLFVAAVALNSFFLVPVAEGHLLFSPADEGHGGRQYHCTEQD